MEATTKMRLFAGSQPVPCGSNLLICRLNSAMFLIPFCDRSNLPSPHPLLQNSVYFQNSNVTMVSFPITTSAGKKSIKRLFSAPEPGNQQSCSKKDIYKTSQCTKVSMGQVSSTEDVNHRCPSAQPLAWGQALHDL